jgi:hypothetical protein
MNNEEVSSRRDARVCQKDCSSEHLQLLMILCSCTGKFSLLEFYLECILSLDEIVWRNYHVLLMSWIMVIISPGDISTVDMILELQTPLS